jgi:AcrR family transcriptional regulator
MPPDERRAAIIEATLPLVLEHGSAVTTRSIAVAAGIAEGTIFRVFPDKDSLIDAVIETVFDPAPTEAALAEIDATLAFEERLAAAVEIVQHRLTVIWRLAAAVGGASVMEHRKRSNDLSGLVDLFEPDRDKLSCEPAVAARMLRGLTLALTHPALVQDDALEPAEIVSLLLDGIRAR